MSTLEQELIRKLENEYKQLFSAFEECNKTIESLTNQMQDFERRIQDLLNKEEPSLEEQISGLRKEQGVVAEELTRKQKEASELDEKMQLARMKCDFHKDILNLWDKEQYYSNWMNENNMSPHEALLQEQGYVIPEPDVEFLELYAADFKRICRTDIANLFYDLKNPEKQTTVFQIAKEAYQKKQDNHYDFLLSVCYEDGFGTEIDHKAALEIKQRLAAENQPLGLVMMANEYFDGDIVEFDQKKAIEYMQRATAAEQQTYFIPHLFWGQRLYDGDGVEKDEAQGLHFLKIADEKGIGMASVLLATRHFKLVAENFAANNEPAIENSAPNSEEIKHMKEHFFYYAKKADDAGSVFGKYLLALCYWHGWGVVEDHQHYLELINQCIALGNAEAMRALACDYQMDRFGPDPIRALKLFFDCLRRKEFSSLDNFKTLLAENLNNIEFMTIAYDVCKKCVQGHLLDNTLDSTLIGILYQHGILVPRHMEKALACLRKAADAGEDEAATALALLAQPKANEPTYLSIAEASKYFSYATADDNIEMLRQQNRKQFMPFFNTLRASWPTIGLGARWDLPDAISHLIAEYAFEPEGKKDTTASAVAKMDVS